MTTRVQATINYERRFLDTLAAYGPNSPFTAECLNDWARQAARVNQSKLFWTLRRQ